MPVRAPRRGDIVKYLLIIHNNPALFETLSPAELDAMINAHPPFQAALTESGELVGFAALADPSQARVVRGRRGAPVVTDGPTWRPRSTWPASTWSTARRRAGGGDRRAMMPEAAYGGVEVRAVMDEAGLEM